MTTERERRRIMRIQLEAPLVARVGKLEVTLLDISVGGARIQHTFPLSRDREFLLNFYYRDSVVVISCSVIRSKFEQREAGATYHSGLRFVDKQSEELKALRDMIAAAISEDFQARRVHIRTART